MTLRKLSLMMICLAALSCNNRGTNNNTYQTDTSASSSMNTNPNASGIGTDTSHAVTNNVSAGQNRSSAGINDTMTQDSFTGNRPAMNRNSYNKHHRKSKSGNY